MVLDKFPAASYPGPMRVHAALLRLEGTRGRHREALKELDAEDRFHTALLRVGLICYALWVGFWLQFMVSFYYSLVTINIPLGLLVSSDPEFFLPVDAGMGGSLANQFLGIAAGGAALAVGAGWWITRGSPGLWRMRFAVTLFATITLGYALLNQSVEESVWQQVEAQLRYYSEMDPEEADPWEREFHQWHTHHYQGLLDRRR